MISFCQSFYLRYSSPIVKQCWHLIFYSDRMKLPMGRQPRSNPFGIRIVFRTQALDSIRDTSNAVRIDWNNAKSCHPWPTLGSLSRPLHCRALPFIASQHTREQDAISPPPPHSLPPIQLISKLFGGSFCCCRLFVFVLVIVIIFLFL